MLTTAGLIFLAQIHALAAGFLPDGTHSQVARGRIDARPDNRSTVIHCGVVTFLFMLQVSPFRAKWVTGLSEQDLHLRLARNIRRLNEFALNEPDRRNRLCREGTTNPLARQPARGRRARVTDTTKGH